MPHKDPEARREYMRRWREKNRNCLRTYMREYVKRWRTENGELVKEYGRRSRARRKETVRETARRKRGIMHALLGHIKLLNGCCICGFDLHPVALEFHHKDPTKKQHVVSRMATGSVRSLTAVLCEVSKCDVICSNCHRILHAEERDANSIPKRR